MPTSVRASPTSTPYDGRVSSASSTTPAAAADLVARSAGRTASAARSAAPSRCRASARPRDAAVGVADDQLGRAAADVEDRDRRRVRRPACGSRRRRTSAASSSPETTSGSTPSRSRIAASEVRRRCPRRGPPRSPRSGAPRRRARRRARRTPRRRRTAASSASSASRPVRSTSWPSRTMRISRTRLSCVPAATSMSATSSLTVLVPQSTAATRVTAPARSTHGPGRPEVAEQVDHLVAERVHAAPLRQGLAGQHVQALHPGRHAAGRDAGDLGHVADRLAEGEVGLVGARRRPRRGRRPPRAGPTSPSSGRTPPGCRSSTRPGGR